PRADRTAGPVERPKVNGISTDILERTRSRDRVRYERLHDQTRHSCVAAWEHLPTGSRRIIEGVKCVPDELTVAGERVRSQAETSRRLLAEERADGLLAEAVLFHHDLFKRLAVVAPRDLIARVVEGQLRWPST